MNTLAAFDTCGYCGEQFTNEPTADWNERTRHLINTHKFGECNQSKKFFRADHFRQHLKHSHAGTSGKWTNMLETACMKDEPNPEPQDNINNNNMSPQGAPVANMGMVQPNMGQANMGQSPMGQANMGQAHMGQANMGQNMGQVNVSQANQGQGMDQAQMAQMAQMDMSNIDPSIGLQTIGNMAPMGNLGNMAPPGRRMGMQGVHDRIDEMPSDM
ncbi:hypothetical protein OEA41_003199 [Lepraria neglecta]|uniref:C2H2-type domain-containing protein n=1 Tax=Lepraria neglecta TaxID=209136 RepID=A0AAE0DJ42_9LECA|nr:hypothetical protein OEA41_003199 [Lepraria neglecta]